MSAEKSVNEYLAEIGVTHSVIHRGERNRDGWQCDAWLFDVINSSKTHCSFEYFTGLGHRSKPKHYTHFGFNKMPTNSFDKARIATRKPVKPDITGLIYSLLSESSACTQSFESWCDDFGYNSDSRKAFKLYETCQASGDKLAKLFTSAQIEKLRELLLDY